MAKPSAASPKAKPKAAPGKFKGKPASAKPALTKAKAAPRAKRKGSAAAPPAALESVAPLAPDHRLNRLWDAVQAVREGRRDSPRTARLLAAGAPKMAQKVVEEAAEVAIEAVLGRREALVNESVDLLYNLAVLWNGAGVKLDDLWAEMDRREAAYGMAEKLPKTEEV